MKRMMIRTVVLSALVGLAGNAKADGTDINFDGINPETVSFSEMIRASSAGQDSNSNRESFVPEAATPETASKGLEVKVRIKSGSLELTETLLCQPDRRLTDTKGCKKQSDLSTLTPDEADAMMLRRYFPIRTTSFSGLADQSKHSYTNQSGPQTFHCVDDCKTVCKPVRKETKVLCGVQNALPVYCVEVTIVQECKEECSHACECIAGCYN